MAEALNVSCRTLFRTPANAFGWLSLVRYKEPWKDLFRTLKHWVVHFKKLSNLNYPFWKKWFFKGSYLSKGFFLW